VLGGLGLGYTITTVGPLLLYTRTAGDKRHQELFVNNHQKMASTAKKWSWKKAKLFFALTKASQPSQYRITVSTNTFTFVIMNDVRWCIMHAMDILWHDSWHRPTSVWPSFIRSVIQIYRMNASSFLCNWRNSLVKVGLQWSKLVLESTPDLYLRAQWRLCVIESLRFHFLRSPLAFQQSQCPAFIAVMCCFLRVACMLVNLIWVLWTFHLTKK